MTRSVASARQPVTNMVPNAGFEYQPTFVAAQTTQATFMDGTAAGVLQQPNALLWLAVVTYAGTCSAQYDSTVSHSGAGSLRVSTGAAASAARLSNIYNTSASVINKYGFPILPNTSYTASYWMKTAVASGSATTGARIRWTGRDAAAGVQDQPATTNVTTTTGWTQYTVTFTTSSTSRFLTPDIFVTGNDGSGTLIMDAWFDDLQFDITAGTQRIAAV